MLLGSRRQSRARRSAALDARRGVTRRGISRYSLDTVKVLAARLRAVERRMDAVVDRLDKVESGLHGLGADMRQRFRVVHERLA